MNGQSVSWQARCTSDYCSLLWLIDYSGESINYLFDFTEAFKVASKSSTANVGKYMNDSWNMKDYGLTVAFEISSTLHFNSVEYQPHLVGNLACITIQRFQSKLHLTLNKNYCTKSNKIKTNKQVNHKIQEKTLCCNILNGTSTYCCISKHKNQNHKASMSLKPKYPCR